jgi:aspartate racemase
MKATFYADVFHRRNLDVVLPDENDREFIDNKLFSEIELGIFKDETRQQLEAIIEKMVRERGIDSIILGCTELPLILEEERYAGVPVLNTTKIHVAAIAKQCRDNR